MAINQKLLAPGNYTVKIGWRSGDNNYYTEQPFSD
jgi:hypothetical protein